nr:hypothetical protein BaRGS_007835 [Batillaria attramentaria]
MNDGVAKNSFTRGCGNLRKSALSEHAETSDHKRALQTPVQIASEKFISLAHILMDIIPIVTALNQFFQKKDIDLALIKVKVNQCISDLETMKTEQTGEDLTNWGTSDLEKLLDHFGEEREVTWTDSEGVEQAKNSAAVYIIVPDDDDHYIGIMTLRKEQGIPHILSARSANAVEVQVAPQVSD